MQLHHARLFFSTSPQALSEFVQDCEVDSEVTLYEFVTVAIDDVRKQLITTAFLKPAAKTTRTIIVVAGGIAPEAQHALLKILEEPPVTTKFVLWLQPGAVLLPTLRSRLSIQDVSGSGEDLAAKPLPESFTQFCKANYGGRLELIATITKNKNLTALAELFTGLGEYVVMNKGLSSGLKSQLVWCLSQLPLRGASKKMLWEEIALLLPVEA